MLTPLKILFVEDCEDDVNLLVRHLKKGGINLEFERVDNQDSMNEAISKTFWDLVIADYVLPHFSGIEALKLIKEMNLDIPFIIVSGAIGEDIAAETMKAGAHDYILKNNLLRLVPAIERELKDAEIRRSNRKAEAQLLYKAFYDTLTGLPNRTLFLDKLNQAISHARRKEGYSFTVMQLGIDRFKIINESLGHESGDRLLAEFAERLKKSVPENSTVSRVGSDEFGIILEEFKAEEATITAEKIQGALQTPFHIKSHELFITMSIGIISRGAEYDRSEDILRDVDTAMHKAKILGGAKLEVFDRQMHFNTVARLQMESDLRKALEKREFMPYFQPIISLETLSLCSFEALLRWKHNDNIIYPADFIPLAEETGVIVPIEREIIRDVCLMLHAWNSVPSSTEKYRVSVNISGRQFQTPDFADFITWAIQDAKIDPRYLILEITEGVIMKDAESGISMLMRLKESGVQLYIDDFGTGYSSLSHLLQFPVDCLKIDRSFINRITLDRKHAEIVQAVITLSKKLGMVAVAEGIETPEQLEMLVKMKCEYGQGFYISYPLNSKDANQLVMNPSVIKAKLSKK